MKIVEVFKYALLIGFLLLIIFSLLLYKKNSQILKKYSYLKKIIKKIIIKMGPLVTLKIIMLNIVIAIIYGGILYILIWDYGFKLNFFECILIMCILQIIVSLPVSIGGWGLREFSLIFLLGNLQINIDYAVMVSIIIGVIGLIVSIPGLLVYLTNRKNNLKYL